MLFSKHLTSLFHSERSSNYLPPPFPVGARETVWGITPNYQRPSETSLFHYQLHAYKMRTGNKHAVMFSFWVNFCFICQKYFVAFIIYACSANNCHFSSCLCLCDIQPTHKHRTTKTNGNDLTLNLSDTFQTTVFYTAKCYSTKPWQGRRNERQFNNISQQPSVLWLFRDT